MNLVINILLLLLINFPKIDFLEISGMKQGIRLDDIIVLILLAIVLLKFNLKLKIPKIVLIIYFYIFLSTYLGILFHPGDNGIRFAYILRGLEYSIAFISLYNLRNLIGFEFIFKSTIFLQFILVIEQTISGMDRVRGSFNGPWELVTVLALLIFFYIIYYSNNMKTGTKIKYIALSLFYSLISFSRSSTIGLIFAIYFSENKFRLKINYIIILIFPIFLYIVHYFQLSLFDRIYDIFTYENLNLIQTFFNYTTSNQEINLFAEFKNSADASLAARLGIWFNLISLYFQSDYYILKYLFGIGLGSKSIVVDGFYIRLIFELGIVGFIGYFILLKMIWRKIEYRPIIVFISFTCLTLDPYSASKIIYTIGVIYALHKAKRS